MSNTYIKAKLISLNKIKVRAFTDIIFPNNIIVKILKNGVQINDAKIIKKASKLDLYAFEIELVEPFEFGSEYSISLNELPFEIVDVNDATDLEFFDSMFSYDGDDLGAKYHKDYTEFAIWSPLASSVVIQIGENSDSFISHKLTRSEKGVYRIKLNGDYLGYKYQYAITQSGVTRITTDVYGKAVDFNSRYSVVVDENDIFNHDFIDSNSENSLLKSIIYETNVRDFTEGKGTNIVNKGKYLGFIEEGCKTRGGNPAGLDYLKYLGITHVQLNPILDFRGVDDRKTSLSYNWGYDPISFFAIEGSYSTNPEDGLSRIKEFQKMVDALHKNNIRVVIDVVYNHIYDFQSSVLEKTVPNYYFRKNKKGIPSNASGCGNDIHSKRMMVRKLIVDSAKYLVKAFNIDGFRFDLMGLLDIDTLLLLEKECKAVKPDLIFYGEGWNMGNDLSFEEKACSENSDKIPNFGFFNDTYRDIVKGPTFSDKIRDKGYINGNLDYHFGADYAFHACVVNRSYAPKYSFAHQSINYIECHDNHTLFDKLYESNSNEDEETLLRRVSLANTFLLSSFGVPFIHSGQEFGQSKEGQHNTYNIVKVNNMRWDLVDERFSMVGYFSKMCRLRLTAMPHLLLDNPKDINSVFKTYHWDNGMLCLYSENKELLKNHEKMMILINPKNETQTYSDDDYMTTLSLDNVNRLHMKHGFVGPLKMIIFVK